MLYICLGRGHVGAPFFQLSFISMIHVMLVGFELLYLFLSQSEHKFILGYSCSASRAQCQVYGFALLV